MHQKGEQNTSIITISILLALHMHIRPTRLLENSIAYVELDADKRLRIESIGLNWDDNIKIKEAIAVDEDNEDEKKDLRERNK